MPLNSLWKRLRGNQKEGNGLRIPRVPAGPEGAGQAGQVAVEPRHAATVAADTPGAIQAFGIDLLKHECALHPKQNVFISPLSVYLALAMVENGAGGETKRAMRKALKVPYDVEDDGLKTEAKRVVQMLRLQGGIELAIANALWCNAQIPLAADFVATCEQFFDAAARVLDMEDPASAKIINEWIAEKTGGRIDHIVDAGGLRGAAAMVTNAVFFKGQFAEPFPKEKTKVKPFYLVNGATKQVPMMHQAGMDSAYRRGTKCEAAALRYRGGEVKGYPKVSEIELMLILPEKGIAPEEILNDNLPAVFRGPQRETVLDLTMPRFTMDFESSMSGALSQMGMGIAFRYPEADFARMGSDLFYISEVVHKARLEVDEEGTVAAAATGMMVCLAAESLQKPEYKKLVFDRPFAVLLRDRLTRAVLFAGVVYEP